MKNIEGIKNELEKLSERIDGKLIIPICVDFDSTMVNSAYPNIISENDGCSTILKRWIKEYNVGVILDTLRGGEDLKMAVEWCESKGIPLYGVGKNPNQSKFVFSNKIYGIFSIDDRNIGCPLKESLGKMVVDWEKIVEILEPILIELNKE
ncbi:MAG: hypothetical protein IKT40_08955 [Bacilli bacterium]|nr:hypothetical protein [Bacilli bacterium]